MGRLDGAVILITGGARGMGAAEAVLAAEEGAIVVVTDVLDDLGEAVASQTSGEYHRLDVTAVADWQRVVAAVIERHGKLDGLVNNAGIFRRDGVLDGDVDTFRLVTEINQVGVFNGMQQCGKVMAEQGSGSIVNISSVAGLRGYAVLSYAASKWAVRGMTKAAATELAPHGVRVNSVHPGLIETDMLAEVAPSDEMREAMGAALPIGRTASPDEVANVVIWLLSGESSYVTGAEIAVDGAMSV